MPHPLVDQLRFTRAEWSRAFEGVTPAEAEQPLGSMNSMAWLVGHLAWHEQISWLERAQGRTLEPAVARFGFGEPGSTPALDEAWRAWRAITAAADPYLDTLTSQGLLAHWEVKGAAHRESIGTTLRRLTYHYWFHLGESQAIRQLLGHTDLPVFVGNINRAPYRPETAP
jgi:hypothetical protein